jgi:ubiquinone/menaquinone biosynthesis C-methylase UbiE
VNATNAVQAANQYWGREGLGQAVLDALAAAGKNLDALTVDDLAPLDHYHGGGKAATVRLAGMAEIISGARVLDVGGGLGGPARTLAAEYGCYVTVIDPTESYVRAGELLTTRLGLGNRVKHRVGSGLELPFDDREFDVVWTQNSGMNIADKERLYAGFHRVLKTGGVLAFQEPMAGPVQPPIFPLMWARDASISFLRTPAAMRALIEAAGFRTRAWEDVSAASSAPVPAAARPAYGIANIIMGDSFDAIMRAGKQNTDERRLVSVHAVFDCI